MVVNGAAGVLITLRGRPAGLMAFTIVAGRITAVDGITDPHRVRRLVAAHGLSDAPGQPDVPRQPDAPAQPDAPGQP